MKASTRQNLVISLIADDLVYARLCEDMAVLGLNPENYRQNLADTLVKLMGFGGGQADFVFARYIDLRTRAGLAGHPPGRQQLLGLAGHIYRELLPEGPPASARP